MTITCDSRPSRPDERGELRRMREHERAPGNRSAIGERGPRVDDRDGPPELDTCAASGMASCPAPKMTSSGGGAGHVEEHVHGPGGRRDRLGGGARRVPAEVPRRGASTVASNPASPSDPLVCAPRPDQEAAADRVEPRRKDGGSPRREHLEPAGDHGRWGDRLDVDVDRPAAPECRAPTRHPRRGRSGAARARQIEHAARDLRHLGLEAAAAQHAGEPAVVANQHPRAFAAIGRSAHVDHRGERGGVGDARRRRGDRGLASQAFSDEFRSVSGRGPCAGNAGYNTRPTSTTPEPRSPVQIHGTSLVKAPRARVWALFNDPEVARALHARGDRADAETATIASRRPSPSRSAR